MSGTRFCLGALVVLLGVGQVSAGPTMPTPTHHYTFDTGFQDSSGTNHGTPVGGASIVTDAERGNVLGLDGIDDYVALLASNVPGGSTAISEFTIAGWVKTSAPVPDPGDHFIYGEYSGQASYVKNGFHLEGPNGVLAFDQFAPGGGLIRGVTPVNDGRWHHVAYVQNEPGSFKRKLYLDGGVVAVDNAAEHYTGPTPLSGAIGARFGDHPDLPTFIEGRIDDLRFYDVALTGDQIGVLAIPEPGTAVLLGMGAVGLLAWVWRRRRAT